ncbi:MAG: HAMP domain-containing histidine kinase, partial [Bacteroidia bacterium]|nr:HAMP domain-containing histidine kinase [Bacteroidia bacterium]
VANIISIMKKEDRPYQQVTQVSSNYFVVSMNDSLHPYLLERLLKVEFDRRNINEDFEYVIYDCFTSKIVFSKYIPHEINEVAPDPIEPPKWDKDNHYFGVYFPHKSRYLLSEMGIWWFSSGVLLLVVAFFGYSMSVILKQKKLSEIRNDFINNMTHEFKTPVSTISITGEMLAKPGVQQDPTRISRYATIITEETTRLRNMVERLLQMSAYDREVKLNPVELDLHEIIEHSVQSMELLLNDRNGSISCKLEAPNHLLRADKVHLTNVIYNLLDNAIKYSVENPRIEIQTFNSNKYIHIQIKDNGIGMSKDAQKHIFNKFYRVSTGNIHKVKGFGLGLNYVKLIAKAHKGFVKLVESVPGKGSIFEVGLRIGE